MAELAATSSSQLPADPPGDVLPEQQQRRRQLPRFGQLAGPDALEIGERFAPQAMGNWQTSLTQRVL